MVEDDIVNFSRVKLGLTLNKFDNQVKYSEILTSKVRKTIYRIDMSPFPLLVFA